MIFYETAIKALETQRQRIEAAVSPCRVVFDFMGPGVNCPVGQWGVGFEHPNGGRHAIRQWADMSVADLAASVEAQADEIKAKAEAQGQ